DAAEHPVGDREHQRPEPLIDLGRGHLGPVPPRHGPPRCRKARGRTPPPTPPPRAPSRAPPSPGLWTTRGSGPPPSPPPRRGPPPPRRPPARAPPVPAGAAWRRPPARGTAAIL